MAAPRSRGQSKEQSGLNYPLPSVATFSRDLCLWDRARLDSASDSVRGFQATVLRLRPSWRSMAADFSGGDFARRNSLITVDANRARARARNEEAAGTQLPSPSANCCVNKVPRRRSYRAPVVSARARAHGSSGGKETELRHSLRERAPTKSRRINPSWYGPNLPDRLLGVPHVIIA